MHLDDKKKIKKTIVIIIICIISIYPCYIIFGILLATYDAIYYGYWDNLKNKPDNSRYEKIFNVKYLKEMKVTSILSSRANDFSYFLKIKNNEIFIMDSKRFSTFKINETNIKNYLIEPKIIKMKTSGHLISKDENSPIEISFYINYGKARHVDVFIDSPPEKMDQNDKYLYVKFNSAGLSISSTEKYSELMVNCGENKIPFELLLLKKNNKNLIIIKYPLINGNNDYEDISILDMINFE